MNEEELRIEATTTVEWECTPMIDRPTFINGYITSAKPREKRIAELEKENAELKKVAEFQQSSNMSRHFENKKLKEGLAVGSTFNKALNSMNKTLEGERDKYRNMVFDKDNQLTKAKEIIKKFLLWENDWHDKTESKYELLKQAEQFIKDKTETEQEEPYYVIMNMNCDYEICRRCPKSGLFKGTHEECENWIKEKLSEVEK